MNYYKRRGSLLKHKNKFPNRKSVSHFLNLKMIKAFTLNKYIFIIFKFKKKVPNSLHYMSFKALEQRDLVRSRHWLGS